MRRRLDAQAADLARRRRPWRPALPALRPGMRVALAVLLAVLAIGVYAVVTRPEPVSALEVLQKAHASAQSPEAGGVRALVLRQTSHEWPVGPSRGVAEIVIDTQRWYGGTGRWRVVWLQVLLGPNGAEVGRTALLAVSR